MSTTRAGTVYKMDAQLTELLKTLLEEKQQREVELTEQHR